MTSRLSRAVKELAEALREVESNGSWEVVSEEGSEKSDGREQIEVQGPAKAAKSKEVQVETVAPREAPFPQDWRQYVIFSNPNRPEAVGFVEGAGVATWIKIEKTLRGGKLYGSGARLRRVQSRAEAEQQWVKAFPYRPMPNLNL